MSHHKPCGRGLYMLTVGTTCRPTLVRVLVRLEPPQTILTHGARVLDSLYGVGTWHLYEARAMHCKALDPDACESCVTYRLEP